MTTESRAERRRINIIGGIIVALGLLTGIVFGWGVAGRAHTGVQFNPISLVNVPWHVGQPTFDVRWTNLVLGLVIVLDGAWILWRRRRGAMIHLGVSSILFLLALLIWVARAPGPSPVGFVSITDLFVAAIPWVMTLMYGSMAGVMCERAGVVNIAIEGQLIGGAFVGAMFSSLFNNYVYAAFAGIVVGGLLGLLLAWFALKYRSDQIIIGVAIVSGMTALGDYMLTVLQNDTNINTGALAPNFAIPLLSKIPFFGPLFFNETYFFYVAIIVVGAVSFLLFKTRYGLRVRAVGEHPRAAATSGINVIRVRYINVTLGGAIAGLGGVALTATSGPFIDGRTSGMGYIALAALIFGQWKPSGAVVGAVIFGVALNLATELQAYNIPVSQYVMGMVPYILTIAVVAGLVGRVRPPAADGVPYAPEGN